MPWVSGYAGFWVCGFLCLRVKVDQYHRRQGKSCAGQRLVSVADSHFMLKKNKIRHQVDA